MKIGGLQGKIGGLQGKIGGLQGKKKCVRPKVEKKKIEPGLFPGLPNQVHAKFSLLPGLFNKNIIFKKKAPGWFNSHNSLDAFTIKDTIV